VPNRNQISPLVQKKLKEMNLTADDVIRKALEIKTEGLSTSEGVFFPEGTAFLAWYKDRPHWATVKDGEIDVEGKRVRSLSGAAAAITGRATTNGWDFWALVKHPGRNDFTPMKTLRDNVAK
jgi:hypothetical protein